MVLTIPSRTPLREAHRFLETHRDWLEARLARLPAPILFAPGAVLPLRGVPHMVLHEPDARRGVWVEGKTIRVSGLRGHVSRRLGDWLRREARIAVTERAHYHAHRLGRPIMRVGVRDTVSRWGSCSSAGVLSFSWRLILAPEPVLDYVAAHEVAHLAERHHGQAFWTLVGWLDPDFKAARTWLRAHGAELHRYGAAAVPDGFSGTARECGRADPPACSDRPGPRP